MNPLFGLAALATLDIRRSTKQIAEFQRLQNGILTQMSGTMQRMADEMSQIKQQQGEALAIQRELLARDNLQAYLEEFIYQAEKLVAACEDDKSRLDAPTRFFLLRGLLDHIDAEGIATPMIRGRENKAAFDQVISRAETAGQALSKEREVREAVREEMALEDAAKKRKLTIGFISLGVLLLLILAACAVPCLFCFGLSLTA